MASHPFRWKTEILRPVLVLLVGTLAAGCVHFPKTDFRFSAPIPPDQAAQWIGDAFAEEGLALETRNQNTGYGPAPTTTMAPTTMAPAMLSAPFEVEDGVQARIMGSTWLQDGMCRIHLMGWLWVDEGVPSKSYMKGPQPQSIGPDGRPQPRPNQWIITADMEGKGGEAWQRLERIAYALEQRGATLTKY